MTHFHGISHENYVLKYVGGTLELRKLDFKGLKGQFNVKNAHFRGLKTKIGHYRPIVATKTHPWPIFMEYSMGIMP